MNSEIGGILRKRREEKGLTLEEINKSTKIQTNVLRYLEDGLASEKIGPTYAKSFLKIYAKFLGLDIDLLVKDEFSKKSIKRSLKQPVKMQDSSHNVFKDSVTSKVNFKLSDFEKIFRNNSKLIVIGAVVLLIAIIALTSNKNTKTINKASKPSAVTTKSKITKFNVSENLILLIRAKDDSWLQVKSDSKVVFQRLLTRGSVEKWEAKDKFELRVGNAAGLIMELNGQSIGSLGRRGQVINSIIMTKDGVTVEK